jgi:hypothetical protein
MGMVWEVSQIAEKLLHMKAEIRVKAMVHEKVKEYR